MSISNKAKTTAIIFTVLLMTSLSMGLLPGEVQAQTNLQPSGGSGTTVPVGVTPDYYITEVPYLSVRPNPVGLNQIFLVNMWHVPAFNQERYLAGYTVTITKPDGTTELVTVDSYHGDLTAWFEYVADQVGEWSFKLEYPGGWYPAGNYSSPQNRRGGVLDPLLNDTLVRSYPYSIYVNPTESKVTTITVQNDIVYSFPSAPLPTDYWTRPVNPHLREWWSILGVVPWQGPGGGPNFPADTNKFRGNYGFDAYVQGPNSGHVVWKKLGAISGLVGALTVLDDNTAPALGWTSGGESPSLFYAGRCYDSVTRMVDGRPTSVFECYDIRTGEVYWDMTDISTPTQVEYAPGSGDVPGAEAIRGQQVNLMYIGNGRLIKYDPYTGATRLNVSISPLTTGTYWANGCCYTIQDLGSAAGTERYRLINWTTLNSATSIAGRIYSNTTYARSSFPSTSLVDWEIGYSASVSNIANPGTTASYNEVRVIGYNQFTGEVAWNITYPSATYSGSANCADHGKIAALMKDGKYVAWNLRTGQIEWVSEQMDYPWGETAFGAYGQNSAYGLLYWQAYDGIYAWDWETGKIVWKYKAPANPFETPYVDENGATVFSWDNAGYIVDGKMYIRNSEHSETQPRTRGWQIHCINATTGEGIWKMVGQMVPGLAGDGYLVTSNTYDGYTYTFGRGKTATTVTAPDVAVPLGTAFTIKGTVLDMSPAQPNTPCVNFDSMATQMQYLHGQYPIDGIMHNETISGVPVTLTAINEAGVVTDLGSVTTNGYYGTFSKSWTPSAEGKYEIVASFASDESYGSSSASTAVTVGPAPEPITYPQQIAPADYTWTIVGMGIAIIIVVLIVGALILLRKH